MQRAAIARALMGDPRLLLADEPTGNLDQQTGREILALLRRLNQEQGLTVVMVTHDPAIARQADRTVRLVGGVVQAS
jgi:lipoprotein-releasing system ATP-binding protein